MEKKESENFKYTQKNMVIGNKMRTVVIIDKKSNKKPNINSAKAIVTRKQKCSGCSRKRRRG